MAALGSPERPEGRPHLLGEGGRLLHGGEVAAPVGVRSASGEVIGAVALSLESPRLGHRSDELERLRLCDAPDCDAVLVDLSRNRSRRYCDTGNCGNRANVAAYRARKKI